MAERAGKSPRRAPYMGPARRRPLILDAALDIFSEGGFADASMSGIAGRAGTTKPVLYDCFPGGKQEIFLTLLEREEQRFLDHMLGVLATTRHLPLADALRSGLSAFLDYAEINPSAFRIVFGAPGTSDPAIAASAQRVRDRLLRIMGERASDVAARVGAPPVAGQIYARSIIAVAEEMARWWMREKPMEREALVAAVTAWMMRGLEGILPPELLGPR